MSRIMQPLSEHFLYCSPEAMCSELYRRLTLPAKNKKPQQKKIVGEKHEKSKTA